MLFFLLPSPCSPFSAVHHSSTPLPTSVPLQLPVNLCPQTISVSLLPAFLLGSFCPPLSCFITSAASFSLFSFLYHSDYYSLHSQALSPSATNSNPSSLVVFRCFFPSVISFSSDSRLIFTPSASTSCRRYSHPPWKPSEECGKWSPRRESGQPFSLSLLLSWPKASHSHSHRRRGSSLSTSALGSSILSTEKILKKTPHRGLANLYWVDMQLWKLTCLDLFETDFYLGWQEAHYWHNHYLSDASKPCFKF